LQGTRNENPVSQRTLVEGLKKYFNKTFSHGGGSGRDILWVKGRRSSARLCSTSKEVGGTGKKKKGHYYKGSEGKSLSTRKADQGFLLRRRGIAIKVPEEGPGDLKKLGR